MAEKETIKSLVNEVLREASLKPIPGILWSNKADFRYTGPAAKGFVGGEGYMDQAMRIAFKPGGFLNIDIKKAANVLRATHDPILMIRAEKCMNELAARQMKDSRS